MKNGRRLSILFMALGLMLSGCGNEENAEAMAPELLEPIAVAENTIEVQRQDFYSAIYIDVTVVPQIEELYFTMDGQILEMEVTEGQLVEEGDVLAKIDQTQLNESIKELQETIAYEENIYSMRLDQADLDIQIAETKLAKLQTEYDEQELKKAEEARKKAAEEEARKRAEEEAKKKAEEEAQKKAEESSALNENSSVEESSILTNGDGTAESSIIIDGNGAEESSIIIDGNGAEESSVIIDDNGTEESSVIVDGNDSEENGNADNSSNVNVESQESSAVTDDSQQSGDNDDSANSESAGVGENSSSAELPENAGQEEDNETQEPLKEITKYDLQQAQLAVQEAELAYGQLKDNYDQSMSQRQNEMQSLLDKVGEDTIYASFSGRVVKINVNVGDYVRQYDKIMLLVNEEETLLQGEKFSNEMLSRAETLDVLIDGDTYEVTYIPYDEDEYLKKSVNNEPLPSWFEIEETAEVSFGESGTVRMYRDYSKDTLVVPTSCIKSDDLGDYVYKAEGGQRIKTYVTVGIRTASFVEIVDGLDEGDEVYGAE